PENPESIPASTLRAWVGDGLVTHVPWSDDMASVWRSANIAVLPSYREGLPKALLEAAACARPIVATDVPGCREIARDGVNALLVPPDDAQALADAIILLAKDKRLRATFGEAGRRLVEKEFSAERIGADIVALYGQLLAKER